MANTRAKVTKNIEIVNEIAEKFLPRLSFYHKCNKSLASFAPHALKGQKLLAQGNGHKQHALKGQKLLAQGSALGYHVRKPVALKGQKLKKMPGVLRLLPLQGALLAAFIPRALPWAKSFCPFRACCSNELLFLRCPGLRASAPSGRAAATNCSFYVALG